MPLYEDYGIEDPQGLEEQNLNAQREGWGAWKKLKSHATNIVKKVTHHAKRIGNKIKKGFEHVKKKVVATVQKAKTVIGTAVAGVRQCGGSIMGAVTNPVAAVGAAKCLKGVADTTVKQVKEGVEKVAADVKKGAEHMKSETQKEIATMQQIASKSASQAVSAVVGKADEVKKQVAQGKLTAAAAIDTLAKSALSEGVKETVEISGQTGELKTKLIDAAKKETSKAATDMKKIT